MTGKCKYIREHLQVPAEIGRRISYKGRLGTIKEDRGKYLGVVFDDGKSQQVSTLHPTWKVEYLEMETENGDKTVTNWKQELKDAMDEERDRYNNEATQLPYWLILDPEPSMRCGLFQLATRISGPFFSREKAQSYLDSSLDKFGEHAIAFCMSGHHSSTYEEMVKEACGD